MGLLGELLGLGGGTAEDSPLGQFEPGDRVSVGPCQILGRRTQARVVRSVDAHFGYYELETLEGDRLGCYVGAQLRRES